MAGDVVIQAENLGKKYLIGRAVDREYQLTLRDGMARIARQAWRKAARVARGRATPAGGALEEFWALRQISFEVRRGEVLGIIGRNGAGKSTLLKILSRITEPSEGRVTVEGRVASLLEVGTGFHPELTGRQNVFLNGAILGMTRSEIRRKFDEIVSFAGVEKFLDTPIKRYSSGMYVRLGFAVAAHLDPDILIVDEVLAVGDAEFQKKCLRKMDDAAHSGRTVLLVSHNMQAVAALCQHVLVLGEGTMLANSDMPAAIAAYTRQSQARRQALPHIVYERAADAVTSPTSLSQPAVTRVELLDDAKQPAATLHSNEPATFRIWFVVPAAIPTGSVVLSLRGLTGTTLAKFESDPQQIQPLAHAGEHHVDCRIDQLPLLAGEYFISVGLALHNEMLIDWATDAGTVNVAASPDPALRMSVYPEGSLAVRHRWNT